MVFDSQMHNNLAFHIITYTKLDDDLNIFVGNGIFIHCMESPFIAKFQRLPFCCLGKRKHLPLGLSHILTLCFAFSCPCQPWTSKGGHNIHLPFCVHIGGNGKLLRWLYMDFRKGKVADACTNTPFLKCN